MNTLQMQAIAFRNDAIVENMTEKNITNKEVPSCDSYSVRTMYILDMGEAPIKEHSNGTDFILNGYIKMDNTDSIRAILVDGNKYLPLAVFLNPSDIAALRKMYNCSLDALNLGMRKESKGKLVPMVTMLIKHYTIGNKYYSKNHPDGYEPTKALSYGLLPSSPLILSIDTEEYLEQHPSKGVDEVNETIILTGKTVRPLM